MKTLLFKLKQNFGAWWHRSIITIHRKLRQKDHKFKGYKENSRLPCLKNKNKKRIVYTVQW